jgi:transcriptional regulator with XRE-family HTH domain
MGRKNTIEGDAFTVWFDNQLSLKGWSSRELSRQLSTSAGWLSNIRTGRQSRTRNAVNRIAEALGVSEEARQAGMLAAGFVPDMDGSEDIPLDIPELIRKIKLLDTADRAHMADIAETFYQRQLRSGNRPSVALPDDNTD